MSDLGTTGSNSHGLGGDARADDGNGDGSGRVSGGGDFVPDGVGSIWFYRALIAFGGNCGSIGEGVDPHRRVG